jgi:hypothetical protein
MPKACLLTAALAVASLDVPSGRDDEGICLRRSESLTRSLDSSDPKETSMTVEFMDGIVETHNRYREWALGGRKDEYLGGALLAELKARLTILIHLDGDLTSLKIAKGSSGLELTVLRRN